MAIPCGSFATSPCLRASWEHRIYFMRHFSAIQRMLIKSVTEELWSIFSMNLGFPLEITESFKVQLITAGWIWGCSTSHMEVIQLWLCITDAGTSTPALSQLFMKRKKDIKFCCGQVPTIFPNLTEWCILHEAFWPK